MKIGKVKESKGDMVTFVTTNDNVDVKYGQIVKFVDSEGRSLKTYYARIVDAGSCSTLSNIDELRDLIGTVRTIGPYTQCRYINSILFLEKDASNIVKAPTLNPDYGWEVRFLDEHDYNVLNISSGKLKLGYLRVGDSTFRKIVGIDVKNIPRMMAIVGQIGSGKTNAELVLNSSIMLTNGEAVGLIFDFAGELLTGKGIGKGLADLPNVEDRLVYFGLEKPRRNIPYQPIYIGLRKLSPIDLAHLFPDLSFPQKHYAEKLYRKIGSPDWIPKIVSKYLDEDVDGVIKLVQGQKSVVEALLRKLSSLNEKVFIDLEYDYDVRPLIIEALANGKTVLVDISGLREETQKQIVTWITASVIGYYRELWRKDFEAWKRLPYLLITLEEAHKFLAEKNTIFSDIALTYRKYNVGLNAVTPRPSGINRDVFAELWTKIILKTTLKEDRVYLVENTPYLEYSDTELKMLDVGEALLISQPAIHFAVPIKMFDYKEFVEEYMEKDFKPKEKHEIKLFSVDENVI
ncbi:MAG: ATP-binding protein [Candidatus Bathyarchaeota archaeon]